MRRLVLAVGLAAACSPLSAQSLSSTITVASDYLFDGVSQTQGDSTSRYVHPALQASLDLGWDSGFYLGAWASNVDFGDDDPADIELNFYGGYSWEVGEGFELDLGVIHYLYTGAPSDGYDYTEAYFGVTFPVGSALQLFVSDDDDVFGGFSWRVKGTHSFPLGEVYSLDLEATRTDYPDDSYWHGQIGVSRSAGPFELYLGYSDTNLRDTPQAEGRFVFTLSTTIDIF
jgi:uncharacterized protein (TIGR02001 family)